MIVSRTPLRISFVGGGSDLPAFYRTEPGAVLGTAINKYIYITVNRKFDDKIRASYSITEMVDRVDDLKHELIRESLKLVKLAGGIEITSISDIPSAGTGLGSSSSYTVGLLNVLHAYLSQFSDAERLAREACAIEIDICNKPIGKQDQYFAAYGGLQHIQFNPDEEVFVNPLICYPATKRQLENHLLMLYTGITRSANNILEQQSNNLLNDASRRQSLRVMTGLVSQLKDAIESNNLNGFGEVLHQGWQEKRKLADGISNSQLDKWYDTARRAGAIGGKVLGAGGGGFLLLFAPPEKHPAILKALPELKPMDFRFESQGSKIIYIDDNQ